MGDYWEQYKDKSEDFWEGVKQGIKAYAIWKDGKRYVGIMRTPIEDDYAEINAIIAKQEAKE